MIFLKASSSYFAEFCTQRFDTGAATDADATPTATATKNGSDDGAFSLTVTKIDTGRYKITGTVPAYTAGDLVQISVAATVNSVSGKAVIDEFQIVSARPGIDDIPVEDVTLTAAYDAAKSAASQTSVDTIDTIIDNIHDTDLPAVKTDTAAIKVKTDNIPSSPAAVGSKMDIVDSPSSTGLGVIVSAIWNKLLTEITTASSIGKLIKDYLDAEVSSRLATAGYTSPPSVGAMADQVFDELLSDHTTTGSAGKALADAISPSVAAIDAQLSANHGIGAWGASTVGAITYPDPDEDAQPFLDPNDDPLGGVKIMAYSDSDRTTLVDVQITDINGLFAFHLDAGEYWFRAILAGYGNFEWSVELTA